ncbi:HalOD1 output domain-containing protein [Natronococcus sp.]|uniref:HalOD1 output domain-containing protein n=1 Tax=Natronococcus sp. TaxID=35747 RepID=UPI003A4D867A
MGYDPATDASYARFGTDYTTAVMAIVETVATVTNRNTEELSPLYATVDPEALVDLVASNRETPVEVTFSYEGCQVTVSSCGTVAVESPNG